MAIEGTTDVCTFKGQNVRGTVSGSATGDLLAADTLCTDVLAARVYQAT